MTNRHRLPTVFSIYMVDVLCCALGCVVLLWLINFREARDRALTAAETNKRLNRTQSALQLSSSELDVKNVALVDALQREAELNDRLRNLAEEKDKWLNIANKTQTALDDTATKLKDVDGKLKNTLDTLLEVSTKLKDTDSKLDKTQVALDDSQKREKDLRDQLASLTLDKSQLQQLANMTRKEYDATLAKLQATLGQLASLKVDYKDLESNSTRTTADLEKTIKENTELATQIASLKLFLEKTKKDLNEKTALTESDAKELKALTDRLLKSSNFTKELQQQLASLQLDLKQHQGKLSDAEIVAIKSKKEYDDLQNQIRDMIIAKQLIDQKLKLNEKDLEAARKYQVLLQGENQSLLRQTQLIRESIKHRFAGINLTGQRVVFIIDMSGSMALEDENSADPDKWPLLCESVGKMLRSMPNLEKFQVILFSSKYSYLMARNGQWIDYVPETTANEVVDKLKAVKPDGGTNMYDALSEAFRFRPIGLDTIYLLSDGLPTEGEGLKADAQLTTPQKTDNLSRHVRNTIRTVWNRPVAGMPKVRINTVGFFFESPEVGAFLWALARENDGSFVGMSKQ